ncbi:unnamed protein product [Phytophthora fragariaefolia]|uniref:Unnamed protein product n=1 Tax=Phytophthora fragariaefolia TaxID=1490495 RepID=A0A9W6XG70_9STRA|nr:unnamed protein product [Phytophthora fragariaefolia]
MTDMATDAVPVVVNTLPSLNPPLFFEIVEDQVYRSNKCDASSIPFLATLQLNTVVYLSYDDLSRDLAAFFVEKEINVVRPALLSPVPIGGCTGLSSGSCELGAEAVSIAAQGLIRALQYRNIAGSVKTRFENEQFIELFDVDLVTLPQQLPLWFTVHQRLMEEERIALTKGEFFPGRSLEKVEDQSKKELSQSEEGEANAGAGQQKIDSTSPEVSEVPAYQKYFFYLQGPLVSSSVKFSEKKSIIGDDDDD